MLFFGACLAEKTVFAEEGDFTIATGFGPIETFAGKPASPGKPDPSVKLQPVTPGLPEIGNTNIDGTGLFGTSVGIGVQFPQGLFDAGDRTDPVGPGCPAGYIFVDYNADTIMDLGECWHGMVIKGGMVGIGTINPLFNLDVIGTARITGDLSVPTINGQVPLFTETDPTVPASVKDGTDWTEISNIPADIADGDQVGITTETDPTVPNTVKDGTDWTEVSNIPADIADGDQVGITTETDPTVPNTVKDGTDWTEISNIPADIADGDQGGVTTETDPTVLNSVKDGITWTEISNRPSGLDNGDQIGILAESDPTVLNSVKDGVSWSEISGKPAGFADNVDNVGILIEVDPQVGANTVNVVPKWDGSALSSGSIYNAPTGNVGIGTTDPKGVLDLSSTSGAFIVPRMNTTERDALTSVAGSIIFNTTNGQFEGYDGTNWASLVAGGGSATPTPTPETSPTPMPTPTPAASGPYITSHVHGSTVQFTSSNITVTWTSNNTSVTEYFLEVGRGTGMGDIWNRNMGTATSALVSGVTTGRIWLRLWWRTNGAWFNRDIFFDLVF